MSGVKEVNIRDEVVPVLLLLQTTEGHLGAGDVLLGVLEVGELEGGVSMHKIRDPFVRRLDIPESPRPR